MIATVLSQMPMLFQSTHALQPTLSFLLSTPQSNIEGSSSTDSSLGLFCAYMDLTTELVATFHQRIPMECQVFLINLLREVVSKDCSRRKSRLILKGFGSLTVNSDLLLQLYSSFEDFVPDLVETAARLLTLAIEVVQEGGDESGESGTELVLGELESIFRSRAEGLSVNRGSMSDVAIQAAGGGIGAAGGSGSGIGNVFRDSITAAMGLVSGGGLNFGDSQNTVWDIALPLDIILNVIKAMEHLADLKNKQETDANPGVEKVGESQTAMVDKCWTSVLQSLQVCRPNTYIYTYM